MPSTQSTLPCDDRRYRVSRGGRRFRRRCSRGPGRRFGSQAARRWLRLESEAPPFGLQESFERLTPDTEVLAEVRDLRRVRLQAPLRYDRSEGRRVGKEGVSTC